MPDELKKAITGLRRQNAAGVVHKYLLDVLKEPDEADIRRAYVLKDLFDCRVCVNHVAQVWLKGIMGDSSPYFDMDLIVDEAEAEGIVKRVTDPGKRLIR